MKIRVQAAVDVGAGADRAYALATDMARFHEFFRGYGPVPAVLKVEWQPGNQPVPGALRNVHNSDGSVIVEQVVEMTAPARHRYRLIAGFKPPFSLLVRSAQGDWTFTPAVTGTQILWRYEFELTSPLAWPLAMPIVRIFFARAMQDCLDAMAAHLRTQ